MAQAVLERPVTEKSGASRGAAPAQQGKRSLAFKNRVRRATRDAEAARQESEPRRGNYVLPAPCYARGAVFFGERKYAAAGLMFLKAEEVCLDVGVHSVIGANQRAAAELAERAHRAYEQCLARMDAPKWQGEKPRAVKSADVLQVIGDAELINWLPGKVATRPVMAADGSPLVSPGDAIDRIVIRRALKEGLVVTLAACV